ncbi:hypothetical protein CR51_10210 [Caballeronia megalochromosomata]|nr:hypothetical protein CR51_10210 [Caballeronia megalochromosomata]
MSEIETVWAKLASRATRVVLARKDVSYDGLMEALASNGIAAQPRSVVSRISRGTLRLSLFLQIVSVTGARMPERWSSAVRVADTWEQRARAVCEAELARQPTENIEDFAERLRRLGTAVSQRALSTQINNGIISLSLFLQLLYLLNADSLDRFLDPEDIIAAAMARTNA